MHATFAELAEAEVNDAISLRRSAPKGLRSTGRDPKNQRVASRDGRKDRPALGQRGSGSIRRHLGATRLGVKETRTGTASSSVGMGVPTRFDDWPAGGGAGFERRRPEADRCRPTLTVPPAREAIESNRY